jgi:hypothetical protein
MTSSSANGAMMRDMFENTPTANQYNFTAMYGNHNSNTRVQRSTNFHYRSGHGTSGGVHQASNAGSSNSSVGFEFIANWGTDPNHSFTVYGLCNGSYRNAPDYNCSNTRTAIFGINW